ncbi:MAG: hypothetical protein C0609_00825 [Deltaproteobacteria bacterium]|nr:MAG: hypothetical protein C0609_00825 [Deltaproteobacteria bacterium]
MKVAKCTSRMFAVLIISGALVLSVTLDAFAFRNLKPGEVTPNFTATAAEGGSVEYAPPTEEVIILAFVRQGQDKSGDLIRDLAKLDPVVAEQVQVLALVVNPSDGDPVAWAKGLGAKYPILIDENEKNYGLFGVVVAPEVAVIAPDGKLKESFSGHTSSTKISVEMAVKEILGISSDGKAKEDLEVNIPQERKLAMRELQKARMFIKRKMRSKAAPQVQKATEADPTYLEAWILLGELSMELDGGLDQAETAYKKVSELDPKEIMGKVGLARVRAKKGDYEGAAAELEKTAMVSPNSDKLYFYLGMMHEEAGNWEKAAKAYRKSAEKCHEVVETEHQ